MIRFMGSLDLLLPLCEIQRLEMPGWKACPTRGHDGSGLTRESHSTTRSFCAAIENDTGVRVSGSPSAYTAIGISLSK